jgi:hypothetical protein
MNIFFFILIIKKGVYLKLGSRKILIANGYKGLGTCTKIQRAQDIYCKDHLARSWGAL